MEQETLLVKFDGQSHQVDVQTFSYSVLNLATVIKEANKKLGGKPMQIHIKAPEKGSLLVNLIATVTNNPNLPGLIPDSVGFIADVVTVVGGLYKFHGFISGKKVKETKKVSTNITVELDDGSTMTVAENIYNIYVNTPAIPTGIAENFSALNEDPAVSRFEVTAGASKKIIDVNREDYSRLAIKQHFETENTRTLIEAANLYIYKVVFDKTDRKWEFYHNGNRISANISDENFYQLIDRGESFSKGDQLKVDLQINQILDESVGIHVNQSYQVIKVHEHIKRSGPPQELPFNKDF
jgi:hypothetical protein